MPHSFFVHNEMDGQLFMSKRHVDVECIPHLHSSMEIILVNEGVLEMVIDEENCIIHAGEAAIVCAYELHAFHSAEHNCCHVLMFFKEVSSQVSSLFVKYKPRSRVFPVSALCMALTDRLLPAMQNTADAIHAMAVLSPLLCELQDTCGFDVRNAPANETISNVLEYMDEHFCEEISLESVASVFGIHAVTLSRQFKARFKTNFNAHLNYLRTNHAANLIKTTNLSFTEIAFSSGFGTIRSFNRAFQRMFQVTPTAFMTLPAIRKKE